MNIITPDYENRQLNSQKTHQTPTQRDIGEILSQQRTRNEIVNESNNGLFLTDEEIDIIKQGMPNSQIRKIVIQIIDEFGKRICKGENSTSNLLYNVSMDVQYKNKLYGDGYTYQFYAEQLINKLPDWKGFCYFISNNWNIDSNNQYLIEFRNKRAKSIDYRSPDKIQQDPNIKTVSNYESNFTKKSSDTKKVQPGTITKSPISTESTDSQLTQEKVKKQKVRPKYETVIDKGYVKKFKDFKRTENIQTDVPLLSPEDIAFSIYNGGYECITQHKQTKVPSFDVRQNGGIEEFIKKNGKRNGIFSQLDGKWIIGRPYSFYNEIDDISHIMIFCDNRGLNAGIHISIKGKVSQHDANELIKYLKNKYEFEIDPFTGNINNMREINRGNIQETVMNFFNNK